MRFCVCAAREAKTYWHQLDAWESSYLKNLRLGTWFQTKVAAINPLLNWEYSDAMNEYDDAIDDILDFKGDEIEKMKQEIENLKDALLAVNFTLETEQQ